MSDILGRLLGAVLEGQQPARPGAPPAGLAGALGGLLGGGEQAVGGLDQVTNQLRQAGLGHQVDSWIGTGANEPIAPEALMQAFGRQPLEQLGQRAGTDGAGLAGLLAAVLPAVINAMTPQGRLPQSPAELPGGGGLGALLGGGAAQGGGLGALAGMLGGAGGAAGAGGLMGALGGLMGGGAAAQPGHGGTVGGEGLADGAAYGKRRPGQGGGMKD